MDMNLDNNACKYTNVYSMGKNDDFKIVDTHVTFLKGENEEKE